MQAHELASLRKAAKRGDAGAQFELGYCIEHGDGVAQDAAQAVVWYRKAAEQGNADAQFKLGLCLDNGTGVAQDAVQAAAWYRKAAEQGHAGAQHNLGALLLVGVDGVPKDVRAAARSIAAAAQQGLPEALKMLALLAGDREVAHECCAGCGRSDAKIKLCIGCRVASFCGKECAARMWPVHKPHCKRWKAEASAARSTEA